MRKTSKSKDPKAVRAFLACISITESIVMPKASTSSDRSEGCGTEGDVVFEDLEVEGKDLLIANILSNDDEIDNELIDGDLDDIE